MDAKRCIFSTDGLNRHGYRVLSNGISLDNYRKNPVLLLSHNWDSTPIGTVEDLRIENGTLSGVPVFDENDPVGAALKMKMEKGIMSAFSIGIDPITTSAKPADLLPGQKKATVTKSDLLEISLVSVPANPNAIMLSAEAKSEIPEIVNKNMQKSALLLGLAADAGDDDFLKKIKDLQTENAALRAEADELKAAAQKSETETVLALGAQKGMVNDTNRPHFLKLAAADPAALKAMFEAAPEVKPATVQTLASKIKPEGKPAGEERSDWDFGKWSKEDSAGLLSMKKNDPEKYSALASAYKPTK